MGSKLGATISRNPQNESFDCSSERNLFNRYLNIIRAYLNVISLSRETFYVFSLLKQPGFRKYKRIIRVKKVRKFQKREISIKKSFNKKMKKFCS